MSTQTQSLDFYAGKTILITGANAYIGPKLAEVLSGVDCKLLLHGHSQPKLDLGSAKAKISFKSGDISASGAWEELLPGVDLVFHLAAHETKDFEPAEDLAVN